MISGTMGFIIIFIFKYTCFISLNSHFCFCNLLLYIKLPERNKLKYRKGRNITKVTKTCVTRLKNATQN